MAKKKKKDFWTKLGVWSFIAGLAIALLVSLFTRGLESWSYGTLAVLGLVVGLVNIVEAEVKLYLLGTVTFIISAYAMMQVFGNLGVAFNSLRVLMEAIVVFVAPGALVVSFKALYEVAKDE